MVEIKGFKLIGLALETKTVNKNGRSAIDCGNLWQKFEKGHFSDRIPGKLSNEIFAVYHNYEGDYRKPFSYFIGCKVKSDTQIPDEMTSLQIPDGKYLLFKAIGEMPDCISKAWGVIWSSDFDRAYSSDFEIYGEKSRDRKNVEIDIFLSIK
jgi:predicted transcriptional regulator YdeE